MHRNKWKCNFTIVTGGSNNLSPGTSIHVISNAPESPGEHGVTKSWTINVLSNGEGPLIVCNKRNSKLN